MKTQKQKIAVLNQYKKTLDDTKKTFKTAGDLVEYEGLKIALLELNSNDLALKRCAKIKGNLKSKFYPRGIASKHAPAHYRYALQLLKPFCS